MYVIFEKQPLCIFKDKSTTFLKIGAKGKGFGVAKVMSEANQKILSTSLSVYKKR